VPASVTDPRRRALVLRAFRLSGVVPLAAFLVVHAAVDSRAVAGDQAFLRATRWLHGVPALPVVEVVLVLAPLLLHAAVGLWMVAARVPLATPSPYPPPIRAAVRATGVLALAFVAMHLLELRFRASWSQPSGAALLTWMNADLSSMRWGMPLRAVAYLAGSACACFHLAAGLWGFFAATPRGAGRRARRFAAWWSVAVGAILWAVFANAAVYHATGSRLFGRAADGASWSSEPCP
jgi:succinate dehydrogenase/fumarate reductase cytochrome b subunit